MRRPRSLSRYAVLATAGLLALTGCGGVHPGSAAVVGKDTISTGQVDALASGLCSANQGNAPGAQAVASRTARQGALQVLIETDLSQQFGKARGVTPSQKQISAALANNAQTLQHLPEQDRAAFKQALVRYWEGQLMLIQIGRSALQAQGQTNVSNAKAIAAGQRLRAQWAKNLSVSVDPRFGSFQQGSFRPATDGGSISVPASEQARAANSTDPNGTWVSGLPASQKCG